MSKLPHIILILVDSLREDILREQLKHNTSLALMAKKGIYFKNAFSTANETDPSLTSIFTGCYPITHGITNHGSAVTDEELNNFNRNNLVSLPQLLKLNGYKTFGLDFLGRWHQRGFDYYLDSKKLNNSLLERIIRLNYTIGKSIDKDPSGLLKKDNPAYKTYYNYLNKANPDQIITKETLKIIKKLNQPSFIFVHFWGLHYPYFSPLQYLHQKAPSLFFSHYNENDRIWKIKVSKLRYKAALRQINERVENILQTLQTCKKLKDTIIILTGDHGDDLLERSDIHNDNSLYDSLLHIPLIFYQSKKRFNKKTSDALVQNIDLLPTINAMLKANALGKIDGVSLLPLIEGKKNGVRKFCLAQGKHKMINSRGSRYKFCLRNKNYKIICEYDLKNKIISKDSIEIFDIRKDNLEINNIATNKKIARSLINNLLAVINRLALKKSITDSKLTTKPIFISRQDEELVFKRLNSLGYL